MALWDWLSYPFRRQKRVPLSSRRPSRDEMGQNRKIPLGMEATDVSLVDRVTRRNDALERTHAVPHQKGNTFMGKTSLHVDAMPEDETYAARYARAFLKKGADHE